MDLGSARQTDGREWGQGDGDDDSDDGAAQSHYCGTNERDECERPAPESEGGEGAVVLGVGRDLPS